MQTTTNYGFKTYQSGDLFNPLTTENYNSEKLDTELKAVDDRTIGRATELVSGGVHAITLLDTDCKTFKFTATGNYDALETFTLNGIAINAYLPDGSALQADAYKTGAVVMCSRNSDDSALTFYLSSVGGIAPDSEKLGGELPAYYATKSYADGIKSTADSASTQIQKKALVNTFYDTSVNKLYLVNVDGSKGVEIPMGTRLLDYANAVDITPSTRVPLDYTPTKDGVLIIACRTISGDTRLYIDNKPITHIPSENDITPFTIEGIGANSHIYTLGNMYEDTTGSRMVSFVPYK